MSERRHADPSALRQALTDLHRQVAYDRLLSRVFATKRERWVLKGATALLARLQGSARHTVDIDLYRRDANLDEAEVTLRAAAAVDLGDFFRFESSSTRRIAPGGTPLRVPVIAFLGATEFAHFHVDLIIGLAMTG